MRSTDGSASRPASGLGRADAVPEEDDATGEALGLEKFEIEPHLTGEPVFTSPTTTGTTKSWS